MNKICTSQEQSKKLAEILPLESAVMAYLLHSTSDNPTWRYDNVPMILADVPINDLTCDALPCWSLAALLSCIPCSYGVYRHPYDDGLSLSLQISNRIEVTADNEVDACYEMILELNKLNLLRL